MKKALILLFIFILAFSIRFAFISENQRGIATDEIAYDNLATNILEGKGYINSQGNPSSYRPPFYSVVLAVIYGIFGHNYFIMRIFQALIGSLTACLLYLIAERVFNRTTAILTGVFSSVYMAYIWYTNFLFTETIFTFILALIVFVIATIRGPSVVKFLVLGFLCAFLTLTKSSAFFIPLIAICILCQRSKSDSFKKVLLSCVILLISFICGLLPWTIRNYNVYGKLVPVSTNGGLNFYQAVNPVGGKIFELGPRRSGPHMDKVAVKGFEIEDEVEQNSYFFKEAVRTYRENPAKVLKVFPIRFLFFWNFIDWNVTEGDVINYHYIFILPFSLLGIMYSLKNKKDISILLFIILYFAALILLFQGAARFRMPIDGYLIILGCYGIHELVRGRKNKIFSISCISGYFLFTYVLYRYSVETKIFVRTLMENIGLW